MGWMEIKDKYAEGISATPQEVEDVVARRVLRGLGLTEKRLPDAERFTFGEAKYDDSLWQRTYRLAHIGLRQAGVRGVNLETLKVNGKHKDVATRFTEAIEEDPKHANTVYLTRIGKTKKALAYALSGLTGAPGGISLTRLKPPFVVQDSVMGYGLIVQNIEDFIEQFGPYEWRQFSE